MIQIMIALSLHELFASKFMCRFWYMDSLDDCDILHSDEWTNIFSTSYGVQMGSIPCYSVFRCSYSQPDPGMRVWFHI